jgi:hypothetical protein
MLIGLKNMDIRSYCRPSASSAHADSSSSSSEKDSDSTTSDLEPPLKKQPTKPAKAKKKHRSVSDRRKYSKNWEKEFNWLEYDEDSEGVFCKICKQVGKSLQRTGGTWVTKPFKNWKKAIEKMKAHAQSDTHIQASKPFCQQPEKDQLCSNFRSLECKRDVEIQLQSNLSFAVHIFLQNSILHIQVRLSN